MTAARRRGDAVKISVDKSRRRSARVSVHPSLSASSHPPPPPAADAADTDAAFLNVILIARATTAATVTRSTGTVHTSAKAPLTSVAIRDTNT